MFFAQYTPSQIRYKPRRKSVSPPIDTRASEGPSPGRVELSRSGNVGDTQRIQALAPGRGYRRIVMCEISPNLGGTSISAHIILSHKKCMGECNANGALCSKLRICDIWSCRHFQTRQILRFRGVEMTYNIQAEAGRIALPVSKCTHRAVVLVTD